MVSATFWKCLSASAFSFVVYWEQLDALRATAQYTTNKNAEALKHFQKVADTMTSFMEIANHRLDNFATIPNDHQTMLQTVSHSVSQLSVDVHLLQVILASAIHNITRFVTALNDLDDIRIIEGLAHGQLSPILLPPSLLTQTFFSIYADLVNRSLDFNLKSHIHGDADFYRTHNFVTAPVVLS